MISISILLSLVLPAPVVAGLYDGDALPRGVGDRMVTLDLRQMEIRSALNLIAEQHGLNVVAGD